MMAMRIFVRLPRLLLPILLTTLIAGLLVGCAESSLRAQQLPTQTLPAATEMTGNVYSDPTFGFRMTLPAGWRALSYAGQHQPSDNTLVVLQTPVPSPVTITIGVFHGAAMPAAFAARGEPPLRIGGFPALSADTGLGQGKVPCIVRIFLAGDDYVLAEWCAMDAANHVAEFERILSTYIPSPAHYNPPATARAQSAQSCADIQAAYGYETASWGRTLAIATSTSPDDGWATLGGASLCSNSGSPDHYLFQCTELVNRWDAEQWGVPHIPGNAARYFDYYQNGTLHPGAVRDLPAGSYAYSDDASQGQSVFTPQPGDLLVFQDVVNPAQGWTSGLIASPGHIALITAIDAGHVYIAQENYNDHQYFLMLTLTHTARGDAITDRSGVAGRIVRGWIHFTVEGA